MEKWLNKLSEISGEIFLLLLAALLTGVGFLIRHYFFDKTRKPSTGKIEISLPNGASD